MIEVDALSQMPRQLSHDRGPEPPPVLQLLYQPDVGVSVARGAARSVGHEIMRKLQQTKVEVDVNLPLKEQPSGVRQIGEGEVHDRE